MTTPLQIAFNVDTVTGAAVEHFQDLDNGVFTSLFLEKGTDLAPEGLSISWDERVLPKEAAGFTTADGKAIGDAVLTEKHQMSMMADIKLKKSIPASRVLNSRTPGDVGSSGEAYISSQLRGMVRRVKLSSELLSSSALKGSVSVASGTVPGTTAAFTLTFGVTSATSVATWATAGTGILGELETLEDTAYAASRLVPKKFYAGKNVKGYLQKNTGISNIYSAGDSVARAISQMAAVIGPSPDFQLGGKEWHINTAGRDVSGTLTRWLSDDQIIALPGDEDLPDVLGYGEGQCEVPASAIGNGAGVCVRAPRGIASYVTSSEDPAGYNLYVVYRCLFVLLNPAAVCVYDTTT